MSTRERNCQTCGIRCRKGWLRVHTKGQVHARTANLDPDGEESVYCSEACLRVRLLGPGEEAGLIRELERKLRNTRRSARDVDFDYYGTPQQDLDIVRSVLRAVADQAQVLQETDPSKAVPGSEEAERFQHAAANIMRLLDGHLNPRRPAAPRA
ncbi:hypothetical protein [Actinacidiphila acidipaludis]|uniref:C2H2-type domain-containing protein n=1 Tax=Actinacidiphila acidipaludis TaxID=2873382 RepID=A0ABS7Q9B7_9ACTN|nr:hypothetical protein [Streptomyces acidipaludis]MBY8879748.1 hypothetical protein [Streptomyces acidipaludis]